MSYNMFDRVFQKTSEEPSVLAAVTSMSIPSRSSVASRSAFSNPSSIFTFFCILSYTLFIVLIPFTFLSHFLQNQLPFGIERSCGNVQ
ncbi:hypothetical protein Hanom_Chr06g00561101 [Helianthus anomalus]